MRRVGLIFLAVGLADSLRIIQKSGHGNPAGQPDPAAGQRFRREGWEPRGGCSRAWA
jgi:hypothetical protein